MKKLFFVVEFLLFRLRRLIFGRVVLVLAHLSGAMSCCVGILVQKLEAQLVVYGHHSMSELGLGDVGFRGEISVGLLAWPHHQ